MPRTQERWLRVVPREAQSGFAASSRTTALVITERELWSCVGPDGFEDKDTILFSMTTIYAACDFIEQGKPAAPLIRRVGAMSFLSDDERYQHLILPIVGAVESGEREGLQAAQITALCAALMIARNQGIWPRDWDSPAYRPNPVWRPGAESVRRNEPSCGGEGEPLGPADHPA